VTSTKQFVWCGDETRPYHSCEERDAGGSVTKLLFSHGQTISGASYFYGRNHLSTTELTNVGGTIQAQYAYDSYGRVAKIQGSLDADFQYAGYYLHSRSNLNLTRTRAYCAGYGRFLNRDPLPGSDEEADESLESNLYAYVLNNPVNFFDPKGLQTGNPTGGTATSGGTGVTNYSYTPWWDRPPTRPHHDPGSIPPGFPGNENPPPPGDWRIPGRNPYCPRPAGSKPKRAYA
jgi:RHS repeat-associated protein